MIPRPLARSLVARFSGKLGYPRTDEGRKALIDAFQNAPDNARQAADVADDLQVETKYCPDVSEVWRAARALKGEKQIGCEKCDDGFIHEPAYEHPTGGLISAVKICECRNVRTPAC